MSKKEENKKIDQMYPKANKPKRESDNIETNDLPYDPNINEEDMQALHKKGYSMNQNQDKAYSERERPVDFAGKDLDIPGRDLRDTTHKKSEIPDEENQQMNARGARTDAEKKADHPNPDRDIP